MNLSEKLNKYDIIRRAASLANELDIEVYVVGGFIRDLILNRKKIGEIGEINPEVILNFKLEFPVAALELNLHDFFEL